MAEQIGAERLALMSSWEIDQARQAGQLDDYVAELSTPVSHARPYTAPTGPDGKPVVQLTAAEVEALSPREKAAALQAGQLHAYMAGDLDPAKPEPEAPKRAATQFTAAHVALMSPEDVEFFRAEGKLVDYDSAQAADAAQPAGGVEL
ncbi:hypothetical protein [Streptomyces sp. NPDC093260]|uniref:hypothetical protein n=1 Tax=Streptomyces sp. NPDC093260 TaxID=3155073 RepID=UPI003428CEB1